jgi:hypothetical protein
MALIVDANTVLVNGVPIAITGKLKYKRGKPKVDVKTATIGQEVKIYENINYEEAVGNVTFSFQPTVENIEKFENWQDNIGKNNVRFLDTQTGFTKTMKFLTVSEDSEIDFSGEIEVTFIGGQAI